MRHAQTVYMDSSGKQQGRDSKTKRPVVDTHKLEELTFERFLFSDMNKFSAEIKKTKVSVFSAKEYFVEISISHIPTFAIPKTLAEFKAFYKALKLRFSNIQWPEFPGALHFLNRKVQKKQILNKILHNISEVAKITDKDKKALLGIFYAFFLDKQVINKIRKISNGTTPVQRSAKNSMVSTTSTNATENEGDAEADNPEIVNAYQKDIEDRFQNLLHTEDSSVALKESPKDVDPSLVHESPKLNADKSPIHSPLVHSASVPSEFILSEPQNALGSESRKDSENRPSTVQVPRPEQEGERPEKVDDEQDEGRTRSRYVVSISSKSKDDALNVINMQDFRTTSFVDSVGDNEADDAKDKKKKKKEKKEKKEKEKKVEDAVATRKRARESSGARVKEIPNFSGIIYMRLSSENKWTKYFARIVNTSIVLYRSILESSPIHFIPCFRCELRYIHDRSGDYIEFWHAYDEDKFQIALIGDDEEDVEEIDSSELNKDLAMWYEQIRIVSEKITGLELTGNKYSPIGKLQVVIYGAFDVKGLPNNSSCYIRLSHNPYVLATSKTLRNDAMKWKQSFFVPLCDTFFPISLELVCVYNDGWITENLKEEVICTSEILIADIISLKSTNILTINLPMKYTEAKAKALARQFNILEKDLVQPKIEVRLKNLSSIKSYFAPPYADYIEGVKMDSETFSKQLLKLSISRAKRILTYIELKSAELGHIFNFKYPLFSYICLILFTYFIINFNISSLVQDTILLIVFICISKNPKVEKFVRKTLDRLFFQPSHLNPFYSPPRIQTLAELENKKLMGTEKWKYKLVDSDSLVTVLKKAKKSLVTITITLTKMTGFIEKFKNIVTWKDSTRTIVFIIFSLFAYCLISVMTFRMIALLGIWAKFIKGTKYYEVLNKKNQKTARIALQFVLKEYYPEQATTIFADLNVPWPNVFNFNVFQAKVTEKMKDRLSINLPEDTLKIARTPLDFILMLATCSTPLKLRMSPAEENTLRAQKKKTTKFGLKNVIYFIMNVPSDYYRVIHPKVVDIAESILQE